MSILSEYMATKTDEEKIQFIEDFEQLREDGALPLGAPLRVAASQYRDMFGNSIGLGITDFMTAIANASYRYFARIEIARRKEHKSTTPGYTHRISWKETNAQYVVIEKSFPTTEDAVALHEEALKNNLRAFDIVIERI